MTWADYAILAILAASVLLSLVRGFVREAVALLGWILALWLAFTFSDELAPLLASHVAAPSLRLTLAFVAICAGVLLAMALAGFLVRRLFDATVSPADRVLGAVFGLARGALIVTIVVLLAGLTAMPGTGWWQGSALLPPFERLAAELRGVLPPAIAQHLVTHRQRGSRRAPDSP